jgi:hypothetical protein
MNFFKLTFTKNGRMEQMGAIGIQIIGFSGMKAQDSDTDSKNVDEKKTLHNVLFQSVKVVDKSHTHEEISVNSNNPVLETKVNAINPEHMEMSQRTQRMLLRDG